LNQQISPKITKKTPKITKHHKKTPKITKSVFVTGETDCRIVAASGPGMRPRIRSQGACFLGRDDP